jgi:hypothetical protein
VCRAIFLGFSSGVAAALTVVVQEQKDFFVVCFLSASAGGGLECYSYLLLRFCPVVEKL